MSCALIYNLILILLLLVHVFVYHYSIDLLTIWCLIDIFVRSFFIGIFLGVVVFINKILTYDLIIHLRKLKNTMTQQKPETDYIESVIKDLEITSKQNAVKLLGFIVDRKFAIKVIFSTFLSTLFAYIRKH